MKNVDPFFPSIRSSRGVIFFRLGATGAAALGFWPLASGAEAPAPELAKASSHSNRTSHRRKIFVTCRVGKPLPHSLPDAKKREVGLTRETWKPRSHFRSRQPGENSQPAHAKNRDRPRLCRTPEDSPKNSRPVCQVNDVR